MSLSDFALPPWLNFKFIALWVVGLLFMSLVWSWNNRGHEVARLTGFQNDVVAAVSDAQDPDANGKRPVLKPGQVVSAIHGLSRSITNTRSALKQISQKTVEDKKRADIADAALNAQLANFKSEYAMAKTRIDYLSSRPPVLGSKDQVCKVIEDDTNAAWDGWHE